MTQPCIAVFGGTGFLGRRIVAGLVARGAAVRVAVRRPERAGNGPHAQAVEAVSADVRDAATVAAALEGCIGAVNAVSLYVESGNATFEEVHVWGAQNVAQQARTKGLQALVSISGIGVDPDSDSVYIRARARGEAAAREAFPEAAILRPSVMFGGDADILATLDRLTRVLPALPLFGRGETRLQPVHVDNVAEAAAKAALNPEITGVYELGGPDVYSYRELVELVLAHNRRRRLLIPVPFALWDLGARLAAPLPNPPVTRAQVALMRRDNAVGVGAGSLADLRIAPISLRSAFEAQRVGTE